MRSMERSWSLLWCVEGDGLEERNYEFLDFLGNENHMSPHIYLCSHGVEVRGKCQWFWSVSSHSVAATTPKIVSS